MPATLLIGWGGADEPDASSFLSLPAAWSAPPLDGWVFHLNVNRPDGSYGQFSWDCWGTRQFTAAELAPQEANLAALKGQINHSWLRMNVTPGTIDWFADMTPVVENFRSAARLAAVGGCAGVLLDTEEYQAHVFNYYERVAANAATPAWDLYSARVAAVAGQIMQAMQAEDPTLNLWLSDGPAWIWYFGHRHYSPALLLQNMDHGLLAPFVGGLLQAAAPGVTIIDGCENAYGHREASQFTNTCIDSMTATPLAWPGAPTGPLQVSLPVEMDCALSLTGWPQPFRADDPRANYYTPDQYQTALLGAAAAANRFVWVRTEGVSWVPPDADHPPVPAAYVEATKSVRALLQSPPVPPTPTPTPTPSPTPTPTPTPIPTPSPVPTPTPTPTPNPQPPTPAVVYRITATVEVDKGTA